MSALIRQIRVQYPRASGGYYATVLWVFRGKKPIPALHGYSLKSLGEGEADYISNHVLGHPYDWKWRYFVNGGGNCAADQYFPSFHQE